MAAEEDKTTVEGAEPEKKETAKKGPGKAIVFGGIGLGAVVIGVALTLFVIKPMLTSSDDAPSQTTESAEPKASASSHGGGQKKGESIVYAISDIVVNPSGTGGSRFLSISFGFELGSPELARDFQQREMLVRDALITILSSKTVAQLTDSKQKEIMRYQIQKRLADLFHTDELEGVYFTDFVLQ